MKTKLGLILLSFILISSFVCALDFQKIGEIKVSPSEQRMIGSQKANVFIDDAFSFAVEVKGGIFRYVETPFEKPSLEVYTSQSTINRIESSERPTEELLKAYKSGEIRIVKKTFMNKIKFFFAKFFIKK